MDTPGFDAQDRARWEAAASAIAAHTDSDRIRLSLRWLDDAKRTDGVDSFIKFWVRLETLSGADREDDVPKLLRDALGAIYGVDSSAATERFDMGRVDGLRSLIVHQGQRVEISPLLLRYLNAVYLDVLAHTLGVASGSVPPPSWAKVGGIKDLLPSEVGGRSQEVTPNGHVCSATESAINCALSRRACTAASLVFSKATSRASLLAESTVTHRPSVRHLA